MRTADPLSGIAVFLALAERLSFTAAAETLGMSRATVSTQISELERRLGVRLLQRSTRNVVLTEAGAAYRDALTGVLPQIHEAERAAGFFQTEAAERLRISAPPDLGQHYLVPLVAAFLKRYPRISIELELSLQTVNLVQHGFDVAIRAALPVEPHLITRQLGSSPIALVAAPDYLARHPAPGQPQDLAKHACLHFSPLRWGRVWVMSHDGVEVRLPIIPQLEINDGESSRLAAMAGAGVALLPRFLCGGDIRAGRLVPVLPDWTIPAIPLHATYPVNRNAAKVRRFVDFVAATFRAHSDLSATPPPEERIPKPISDDTGPPTALSPPRTS